MAILKSQRKRQLLTIDTPVKRRRMLASNKTKRLHTETETQAKRLRTLEEVEERKLHVTKKEEVGTSCNRNASEKGSLGCTVHWDGKEF